MSLGLGFTESSMKIGRICIRVPGNLESRI